MRITLIVDGPVPCRGYGGSQRQVEWLATELTRLGHRVVVIASRSDSAAIFEVRHASTGQQFRDAIPADSDLVHFHGPYFDVAYPSLNTAHNAGPIAPPGRSWNGVSKSNAEDRGRKTFVYNGFPVDHYRLASRKTDRLLFLAGIARPIKNLNRAVDLARKYDLQLDIAGGSRWKLLTRSKVRRQGVFLKSLAPRFRFHGIVDGDAKLALLGEAMAFINPIDGPEAFGMAPVEAMLCGTPVLATPRGAMPEVIDPETGRLFVSDDEFAAALAEVRTLSPTRCREVAADRFSIEKTAKGYLDLYARILDGEILP